MDAGAVVAIAMGGATILIAVGSYVERRFNRIVQKNEVLVAENKLLDKLVAEKDKVIADLGKQRDDLRITGHIMDRFLSGLPSGPRRDDT